MPSPCNKYIHLLNPSHPTSYPPDHSLALSLIVRQSNLVLASSLLTSFELIKIPAANIQIALVLIHALSEVPDLRRTHLILLTLGGGGHGVRVLGETLLCRGRFLSTATAAEEAA